MRTAPREKSKAPPKGPPRVELFRLFSEPSRLQLLALCAEEELTVSELAALVEDSQPQVSRRLTSLREAGLLTSRRDGTRTYLRADRAMVDGDALVADAIAEGRRLCLADGSLARVPGVVASREDFSRAHFDEAEPERSTVPSSPEHLAHLSALSLLFPQRALAIDVGTGDGLSLDVLAPLFGRVIAVERSRSQLARVAERVAARGFHHISLFPGSYDDAALVQRVDAAGGADLVFAARTLHHASRPAQAVAAFARLLKRGGRLVVLDYLPHQDESLRTGSGDVWQGFEPEELTSWLTAAGLTPEGEAPIPPFFHPQGPDAKLAWHAWVASKPLSKA